MSAEIEQTIVARQEKVGPETTNLLGYTERQIVILKLQTLNTAV